MEKLQSEFKAIRLSRIEVKEEIDRYFKRINECGNFAFETLKVSYTIHFGGKYDIYVNNDIQGRFTRHECLVFLRAFYDGMERMHKLNVRWNESNNLPKLQLNPR